MKRDYSLQQAIDLVKGGMEPLEAAKKVYVDHAYYENMLIAEVIEREIEIDRLREALEKQGGIQAIQLSEIEELKRNSLEEMSRLRLAIEQEQITAKENDRLRGLFNKMEDDAIAYRAALVNILDNEPDAIEEAKKLLEQ